MLVSIEIKYVNPPKEGGEGQLYCCMFNFMILQADRGDRADLVGGENYACLWELRSITYGP